MELMKRNKRRGNNKLIEEFEKWRNQDSYISCQKLIHTRN